jgi:hypothetical protein
MRSEKTQIALLTLMGTLGGAFTQVAPYLLQNQILDRVSLLFFSCVAIQGFVLTSWKVGILSKWVEIFNRSGLLAMLSLLTSFSFALMAWGAVSWVLGGSTLTFEVVGTSSLATAVGLTLYLGWAQHVIRPSDLLD